jgi:two-component system chemotaxis response regulator CheY
VCASCGEPLEEGEQFCANCGTEVIAGQYIVPQNDTIQPIHTRNQDIIRKNRILIIDDSMFLAKQLEQILLSEGFEVVGTAADGIEGFEKYKILYQNIDLVILDISLPKMDGVSVLGKILEFDEQANIIMISSLGKEDINKKCLQMGAKNYIVKPYDRKKILKIIASVL